MSENTNNTGYDVDIAPIPMEKRTLTGFSLFAIWFATNTVTTSMLVGMSIVPGLNLTTAISLYLIGSAVGFIPVMLIGVIGYKTGLPTMALSRATFGIRGSMIPSVLNVVILIAWSWAQAALGGFALNYISKQLFGFDNFVFYTVLTEVVVIFIALYAIKGISFYEKIAMASILIMMGAVFYQIVSKFSFEAIFAVPMDPTAGITVMIAFDAIVGIALSYAPMAADYNRSTKSFKSASWGCWAGYLLGTTLVMTIGGSMVAMVLSSGQDLIYEPATIYSQIGLGVPGSIAIFLSIIAANVMCLYSSTMSVVNLFPKARFRMTIIILGLICIVGAVFSGILDAYLNFVGIVGIVFMPMFAIVIADFFVVRKQKYNVDAIINWQENREYYYYKGFNMIALVVYVVSALISYYLLMNPVAIGATIPAFVMSFVLYILVTKILAKKGIEAPKAD